MLEIRLVPICFFGKMHFGILLPFRLTLQAWGQYFRLILNFRLPILQNLCLQLNFRLPQNFRLTDFWYNTELSSTAQWVRLLHKYIQKWFFIILAMFVTSRSKYSIIQKLFSKLTSIFPRKTQDNFQNDIQKIAQIRK